MYSFNLTKARFRVQVPNVVYAEGKTKKEAEKKAAARACEILEDSGMLIVPKSFYANQNASDSQVPTNPQSLPTLFGTPSTTSTATPSSSKENSYPLVRFVQGSQPVLATSQTSDYSTTPVASLEPQQTATTSQTLKLPDQQVASKATSDSVGTLSKKKRPFDDAIGEQKDFIPLVKKPKQQPSKPTLIVIDAANVGLNYGR